jgi:MFS family permease
MLISIGLYGMANGVMTVVRRVSVLELFGREDYAAVSGAPAAPGTIGRAAGPLIASLLMGDSSDYWSMAPLPAGVVLVSGALFWKPINAKVGDEPGRITPAPSSGSRSVVS